MANSTRLGEVPIDHKPLVDNIQQLFASSKYSDLKIVCEGKIWNVHRNIVCTACSFLELRCQNFRDVRTAVIDLSHDPKSAVQALLSNVYAADYKTDDSMSSEAMLFHVRVHTIANKYGLSKLAVVAEYKFLGIAKDLWASSRFASAIEIMYTVTPGTKKELQYIAIKIAVEHADVLLGDEWSSFARLSRRMPAFAYDLSKELMASKAKKPESTDARTEDRFRSTETKTESKSRSTASRSKKPESGQTWTEDESKTTKQSSEKKAKSPKKKASSGRKCSKCGSSRLYRVHKSLFQRAGIWCKSCGRFRSRD